MKKGEKSESAPANDIVVGRNAVMEAIKHYPERIRQILFAANADSTVLKLADSAGIEIRNEHKDVLSEIAGRSSHQSLLAFISPRSRSDFKQFLKSKANSQKSVVLFLDSIQDPQNLGSILRTAECFGASAVVWGRHRAASLTPVVRKIASGAADLIETFEVSNLVRALELCKDAGFWIVGAEARKDSSSIFEFEFPPKTVIVLGSEGEGIGHLLRKKLDFSVYIPLFGKIDSLNVSQAATVFLYQYRAASSAKK
jgi:23S rRNA (guanosine2251-2'-O)-methyltransferase